MRWAPTRAQSYLLPIAIVSLPSPRALQPRTPPTTPCVLETIRDTKWDTLSREPTLSVLKKKFLGIIQRLQLIRLQLPIQMKPALCVRKRGLSNPLGKPSRAAKHQQHDQIARWILDGASFRFCQLHNRFRHFEM